MIRFNQPAHIAVSGHPAVTTVGFEPTVVHKDGTPLDAGTRCRFVDDGTGRVEVTFQRVSKHGRRRSTFRDPVLAQNAVLRWVERNSAHRAPSEA